MLSDDLAKKLPPTDCRFRPDIRHWEGAALEEANKEKARLENNQRDRRKKLKEIFEK